MIVNKPNTIWHSWLDENRRYWMLLLLAALGLTLGRAVLMWNHAPENWQSSYLDILHAFWIGTRFDLKTLATLLGIPVLLLGLGIRAIPLSLILRFWQKLWLIWCVLVLLLVNLLMVINYYYFQFYQSPINDLIFGLAQDDTQAILLTVWHDFPVLRALALVLILTTGQYILAGWLAGWLQSFFRKDTSKLTGLTVFSIALCSLLVTAGLVRGGFGKFPLRSMHIAVSSDVFTNHLVPNGLWALNEARRSRQRYDLGNSEDSGLQKYGFSNIEQAINAADFIEQTDFNSNITLETENSHTDVLDWRWQKVPAWPNTQLPVPSRPHVVLAVMESWGRQLLDFDNPDTNDLLGRLRPWLNEGRLDFFARALFFQPGTHPSLEALLLDTPLTPLTQTRYGRVAYDTARARFYQQAGYRTVYLTAAPEAWRSLNIALLQQGFDQVLGENAIRKRFPQADKHTWGTDDEWMFRYAQELLLEAEAQHQPMLLVMMSVTNHAPYRVPSAYVSAPLDVQHLGAALASDAETALSIMQTYQYANDALGGFLDELNNSGLLERTLFAATGDHNHRSIIGYPGNSQLYYKYGVPIVMHIPERYRLYGNADTHAWSSQQDIFPTLWAHSLWGHRVPRNGRNLYADSAQASAALSFVDNGIVISDSGAVVNLANPVFYQWDNTQTDKPILVPVESESPNEALHALWQRERARMALRDWRIRSQALGINP